MTRELDPEVTARFTPRMVTTLENAGAEGTAVAGKPGAVGTEHVFLAILRDPDAVPTQVLKKMGVLDAVTNELSSVLRSGTYLS